MTPRLIHLLRQMDELSLAGEEFLRVMVLDALPTSHAVQPNINDISAILNNFDLTSYYKVFGNTDVSI